MEEMKRMLEAVLANQERMAAGMEGLKAEVARLSEAAVPRLDGIESSMAGMEDAMRDANGYAEASSRSLEGVARWARLASAHLGKMADGHALQSNRLALLRQDFEVRLEGIEADLSNVIAWSTTLVGTFLGHLGYDLTEDGEVVKKRR